MAEDVCKPLDWGWFHGKGIDVVMWTRLPFAHHFEMDV